MFCCYSLQRKKSVEYSENINMPQVRKQRETEPPVDIYAKPFDEVVFFNIGDGPDKPDRPRRKCGGPSSETFMVYGLKNETIIEETDLQNKYVPCKSEFINENHTGGVGFDCSRLGYAKNAHERCYVENVYHVKRGRKYIYTGSIGIGNADGTYEESSDDTLNTLKHRSLPDEENEGKISKRPQKFEEQEQQIANNKKHKQKERINYHLNYSGSSCELTLKGYARNRSSENKESKEINYGSSNKAKKESDNVFCIQDRREGNCGDNCGPVTKRKRKNRRKVIDDPPSPHRCNRKFQCNNYMDYSNNEMSSQQGSDERRQQRRIGIVHGLDAELDDHVKKLQLQYSASIDQSKIRLSSLVKFISLD